MWAQNYLGDVFLGLGNLEEANRAYTKAHELAEALAARDPANTEWQRDLSVSHDRIGNVLVAQGDGPGALATYRKGFIIGEALAARDPANTQWQSDLSVSHDRIGDVLVAQGDGSGALATFHKGLVIGEALAARDPANTQWQTVVAVSCARLGLLQHGQSMEVRHGHLRRGRDILQRLKSARRSTSKHEALVEWFDQQLAELAGHHS